MRKIMCVVGARPNFIKIAPILRSFLRYSDQLNVQLVHTGQHYDYAMNQAFFDQLEIPKPDVSLEVGSGSHAIQTAEIMRRFEAPLDHSKPDCVLLVGDVNSTLACALVAAKKSVKIVHVEAGLRSHDRSMPEEINRLLTDQLSDRLYVTEEDAIRNLQKEGISTERIVFVGNVMIDTLFSSLPLAVPAEITIRTYSESAGKNPLDFLSSRHGYAVLTLHRPSNVDNAAALSALFSVLGEVSHQVPILFPMHPRTKERMVNAGLGHFFDIRTILAVPPLSYLEMLGLTKNAKVVLTDSGGLQEEATVLGVPCLTLRHNTERPITLTEGTNRLVGTDPDAIKSAMRDVLSEKVVQKRPKGWDGAAAERITADIVAWLGK